MTLSLITSSCSYIDVFGEPKPVCVSPCGENLISNQPQDCSDFVSREYWAVWAFSQKVFLDGWSSCKNLCKHLNGNEIRLVTNSAGTFTDEFTGQKVYGVDLGSDIWVDMPPDPSIQDWANSAFTHELGHELEWSINNIIDTDHTDWHNNGIYAAIDLANANTGAIATCW